MKRTGEFVLSIMGVSIATIFLIVGMITAVYMSTVDLTEMVEYSLGSDVEMAASDVALTLQLLNVVIWIGIISLVFAVIGGLIAIILLKNAK